MKNIFKLNQLIKTKKLIGCISFLVYGGILMSCTETQELEQFDILGEWQGQEWNCSNDQDCKGISEVDRKESTITFHIVRISPQGELTITDGKRYVPSCQIRCISGDWEIVGAFFIDKGIQIEFHTGHIYTGMLKDGEFVGEVGYVFGAKKEYYYDWNKQIKIIQLKQ